MKEQYIIRFRLMYLVKILKFAFEKERTKQMKKKINAPVTIVVLALVLMLTVTAFIVGRSINKSLSDRAEQSQEQTQEDMKPYESAYTYNSRFEFSNNRLVTKDTEERIYVSDVKNSYVNADRYGVIGYRVALYKGKEYKDCLYFSLMGYNSYPTLVSNEDIGSKEYDLYYFSVAHILGKFRYKDSNNDDVFSNIKAYSLKITPVYGIYEAGSIYSICTIDEDGKTSGIVYDDINSTTVKECYVSLNNSTIGKELK